MRNKKILMRTVQTILAIGITLIMLFPIYWMINTALKPSSELLLPVPRFWPSQVDFGSFLMAWEKVPLGRYLFNTAFVTFWSLFFQIGTGILAAYGFARGRFPGRDLLFLLVIGALMVPPQVTFIPLYTLCSRLGWVNSFQGLILPNTVSAYFIFMMRQAFMTVDQSYIDAGKLEGLGVLGVIRYIMVPMCRPTILTVALISFVGSWNDYFWPKIITNKDEYRMIAVGLVRLYDVFGTNEILENMNVVMSGALISMVPILILFVIFQKYMLSGFTKASMK